MTALDFQLDRLSEERISYSQRLKALIGNADRQVELAAYLDLIERSNAAAIRLAQAYSTTHSYSVTIPRLDHEA
jgi:hypothetical protein